MISNWKRPAQASALAMGLALAGCGGGSGGGLASTPSPAPTPAASYTKIVEMSGDRTFQSAGVRFLLNSSNGITSPNTPTLGNGMKVAYTAASDSYALTGTDGSTVSFDPSNAKPTTSPNAQLWVKAAETTNDIFSLSVPTVEGVALSYTVVGRWSHLDDAKPNQTLIRLGVGGSPTLASDMPRTGTATYSAAVAGLAYRPGLGSLLLDKSTATFSADFAANSVATSLTLAATQLPGGTNVLSFGTFEGTGTIATTGPGFSGTLKGADATGGFAGAFFGPKAVEMAYAWYITAAAVGFEGTTTGIKR